MGAFALNASNVRAAAGEFFFFFARIFREYYNSRGIIYARRLAEKRGEMTQAAISRRSDRKNVNESARDGPPEGVTGVRDVCAQRDVPPTELSRRQSRRTNDFQNVFPLSSNRINLGNVHVSGARAR